MTTISLTGDRDLQISELKTFPENRWREAILHYLFGIWADKESVTYRPKIHFGTMCLRLNQASREYFAYGSSPNWEVHQSFRGEEILITEGCGQDEVEGALIRFVKNDRIRILAITLGNDQFLRLWKTDKRSEYGCHGDVPSTMEEMSS
ncbi:MAG: hypothetical protein AAGA35_01625 [Patescibacteria group bacterium]